MPTADTATTELRTIAKGSDIGPALLARLAEMVPVELVAQKILQLLHAEIVNARGESYPDNRAIEAGVKLYMSYQVGMPVQRQVIVTEARETTGQTLERLLASPASRRALQSVLDEEGAAGAVEEENNGVDSNKLVK